MVSQAKGLPTAASWWKERRKMVAEYRKTRKVVKARPKKATRAKPKKVVKARPKKAAKSKKASRSKKARR